jgi:ribosomal protein L37E
MAIIDEELFVRCERCGSEATTGIRRTEADLVARPMGRRRITCHRCGHVAEYADGGFYHRTVEADRLRVDVAP